MMRSKIKTIMLIFFMFVVANGMVFYLTERNKEQRIKIALDDNLNDLKTHYEILLHHQKTTADAAYISTTTMIPNFIEIFQKAQTTSLSQKSILRTQLYNLLKNKYKVLKTKGVLQYHFVLPNNESFLRMHKPSKFGDDLTQIREDFKYTNETKNSINSFVQGRTAHGFRNTYPIFDKKGNHLGAMEISFSSDSFQENISNISKVHTHFIVDKNIINAKSWKKDGLILKYIQSGEHEEFMLTIDSIHDNQNCIIENKIKLSDVRDKIDNGIKNGDKFAIYTTHEYEQVYVISFFPIKNFNNTETLAWLVSYEKNDFIYSTLTGSNKRRILLFFVFLVLFYFIYRALNQKDILDDLVKEKTYELKNLNESLEERVEEKTKELNTKNNELQQYLNVIDDIKIGLFIVDPDYKVQYMNNTMVEWFGDQQNKICYKSVAGLEEPCPYCKIQDVIELGQKVQYNPQTPDGQMFDIISAPIHNKDGSVSKMEVIRNVTEKNQIQNKLFKSEKMASMGEMIGNIAHQWRQPLSVISTGATGLKLGKEYGTLTDEFFIETCDTINNNAQYLSRTIDDFKNFIKGDRKLETFYIKDNINSFINLLKSTIKNNNIDVIIDLQENIKINSYPNELIQCLINIFNNSKDILTEIDEEDRFIFITTLVQDDKAVIKIKDSGGGIPENILPKIFEPYFTTKHKSQGTGLGLHMSYNLIVDGIGGAIEANNTSYEHNGNKYIGAEFTITLPLLEIFNET